MALMTRNFWVDGLRVTKAGECLPYDQVGVALVMVLSLQIEWAEYLLEVVLGLWSSVTMS